MGGGGGGGGGLFPNGPFPPNFTWPPLCQGKGASTWESKDRHHFLPGKIPRLPRDWEESKLIFGGKINFGMRGFTMGSARQSKKEFRSLN